MKINNVQLVEAQPMLFNQYETHTNEHKAENKHTYLEMRAKTDEKKSK